MRIRYYGHSTFSITLDTKVVLFDPYMSSNPMCETDPMTVEADIMLLSHGHRDHVEDAELIAKNTGCQVIANYEVANWLKGKGVENVRDVNHGGSVELGFCTVKYVNAVHSSELPDGTYGGNAGGFVIKTSDTEIYYAGDTALHMDMELLGRYHDIDIAFLPLGDTYTMGVDDAVIAAQMVDCEKVVGMHYDTFPPLRIDHGAALNAFKEKQKELILITPGESLDI